MYQQLRQDLLARIRRGEFSPGDLLPSEAKLCEEYGISVTTARRALLELVKEGVVYRKAGIGTIVAPRVRRARVAFLSIDYKDDAWRRTPSAMGEIVAGISEACWQRAADFYMTGVYGEEVVAYLRGLVEERSVDGILLRSADDIEEEFLEILEGAGMPYVVVKRRIPGRRMNCVVSDDLSGATMATNHLIDLGHRRIGFVCAKPHITFAQERLQGYRAALDGCGIEPEAHLVRQQPNFTTEEGYRAVKDLLELPSPPSALFVASDTMALGAYRAIRDLGLDVPDDVSLVGYDDISPAAVLQPPLTTVRTSYYDFGRLAAELLLDIIEGREAPPQQRIVEPVLIIRDSTRRSGPAARRPTVRRHEIVGGPGSVEHPRQGRLDGTAVAMAGNDGETVADVMRACEVEGARVVEGREEPADALFYCFGPGSDLGSVLDRASADVRGALDAYPEGKPGSVVCLFLNNGPLQGASVAAVRAGLARVVELLLEDAKDGGTTVNAVITETERAEEAVRIAAFMASEKAVNGEVLVSRLPTGSLSRS
jgi:DNA-binding LacI/PurR family transcriptional regulator